MHSAGGACGCRASPVGRGDPRGARPDPLSGCLKCRSFRLFDIEDLHWTTSGLLQEHGFGYGDGVHGSPEPGNCDVIHGICVNVPRFAARELTKTITDAVAAEDIASLAEFATMTSVNLFADRSAIQVLSCDGETIAGHIPVKLTLLAATEAATAELLEPDA